MKKTLLTMAAALAFVGCTKSELVETPIQEQNAIVFGTYLGDNAQTRASVVTTETLGMDGFGVNAYYTGQEEFTEGAAEPNFMDNTKVTYNKDNKMWEYTPVKYWPNNTFVNGSGETQYEMVSFFAYGPYAKNSGNNNITQNGTSLDFVVADDVKDQVDLIYNTNYDGTINQTKPSVEEFIHFQFAHALSRISFTVEAAVDEVENGNKLLDGNTRINVKKVALVSDTYDETNLTGPFWQSGTLSLLDPGTADDGTPNSPWSKREGSLGFVFNATDHFYHTVKDVDAETEEEIDVVQLTRYNASEQQRLLNDESYLMVIPQENVQFSIYIEYDVISGGYDNNSGVVYDESAITNRITKAIAKPVTFEQGKAYKFNLVLGMTSVKFEVDEVAVWGNEIEGGNVWLPENEPENAFAYADGEILIKNAADLAKMRDLVNSGAKYYQTGNGVVTVVESSAYTRSGDAEVKEYAKASYRQVADIDLSDYPNWTPIGNEDYKFAGKYIVDNNEEEGSPYTISNLYIDYSDVKLHAGLFGHVLGTSTSELAELTNIYLVNPTVKVNMSVEHECAAGGVIGIGGLVNITNCFLEEGQGLISGYNAGGIIGCISYTGTTIANCINYGTEITGTFMVGGIVGSCGNAKIVSCINFADVSGAEGASNHVGGIVGGNTNSTDIKECGNNGEITSYWTSGGIAGIFYTGSITASYNAGSIIGDGESSHQGGIVGMAGDKMTITACYNIAESISNSTDAGGIVGFAAANGITLTACYSTTTTFTDANTYGALVGNNTDAANTETFTLDYSACYFTSADNLKGCGYTQEDVEGVGPVDDITTTWEDATAAMNEVLTEWKYTLVEDETPTVGPNTTEEEGNEEA